MSLTEAMRQPSPLSVVSLVACCLPFLPDLGLLLAVGLQCVHPVPELLFPVALLLLLPGLLLPSPVATSRAAHQPPHAPGPHRSHFSQQVCEHSVCFPYSHHLVSLSCPPG